MQLSGGYFKEKKTYLPTAFVKVSVERRLRRYRSCLDSPLIDKDAEIHEVKDVICCNNPKSVKLLEIDYSRWLSYLISREWEKEEK